MFRENKGVSMVILVVTIIVLLILASVSLSLSIGENGIINQAKKAKNETEIAQCKEMIDLKIIEIQLMNDGNINVDKIFDSMNSDKKFEVSKISNNEMDISYNKDYTFTLNFDNEDQTYTLENARLYSSNSIKKLSDNYEE